MSRNRTLLGTQPILTRLPVNLVKALDEWAEEEGLSRNTLVGRELAAAVMKKSMGVKQQPENTEAQSNANEFKGGTGGSRVSCPNRN